MPPKRRQNQQRHYIEQSDYDSEAYQTDAAGQSHPSGEVHKPVRDNVELNLAVLQRHNPDVHQVLSLASFAVVYLFSTETEQWEKSDIEGPLFVCQLIPATLQSADNAPTIERYMVIILNRKNLHNFSMELLSTAQVEVDEQFIMFNVVDEETGAPQIYGLWVFAEAGASTAHAKEINAQVVLECAARAERSRQLVEDVTPLQEADGYEEELDHTQHNGDYFAQQAMSEQVHDAVPAPGQQIHLANLFGQSQGLDHNGQHHQYQSHDTRQYQQHPPQQQYATPGAGNQYVNGPPPSQPDILLNLFRNAR